MMKMKPEMFRIVHRTSENGKFAIRVYFREEDYAEQNRKLLEECVYTGYPRLVSMKMCGSRLKALFDAYRVQRDEPQVVLCVMFLGATCFVEDYFKQALIGELEWCFHHRNIHTKTRLDRAIAILNDVKQDRPFEYIPEWILDMTNIEHPSRFIPV